MARPRQSRYVSCMPKVSYYKPEGVPVDLLREISLSVESLEAMRLTFLAGLNTDEAAKRMGVSRHTLGRILTEAQKSVTEALVYGQALRISGGDYVVQTEAEKSAAFQSNAKIIAVSTEGSSLDSMVDPRFGRAIGFLIVDIATMENRYIANEAKTHGAGTDAVKLLADAGVEVVMSGHIGPKAIEAFEETGIHIIQNMDGMTVHQAIEHFTCTCSAAQNKVTERIMSTFNLAIPSTNPGGMDAPLGMHFGHCDLYTIVEVENNAVKSVTTLPSIPHAEGGCTAPVQYLANKGVNKMLAGGMGMRPLAGFQQAGIQVYFAGDFATVGQSVAAFLEGKLPAFSSDYTCKGH